jgi:ABC-type phosphate/phosphonate transport system substrate-binding protein
MDELRCDWDDIDSSGKWDDIGGIMESIPIVNHGLVVREKMY